MRRWLLVGALALAACNGDSKDGGGSGGIGRVDASALVTIVTADDAKVLDPHSTSDGGNSKVIHQVFETLVRIDPDDVNRLIPALATKWETAADGLAVTFTLREGVTFHDGAPFDAAAAKLSLDRLREVGFHLSSAPYAPEFQDVTSFDVDGPRLVMRLRAPVARVALRNLAMFCSSIVSPRVLDATRDLDPDAATAYVTSHPMGTGAYRIETFDPAAKQATLTANDAYWGGSPKVRRLLFKPVSDESMRTEYLTKASGHVLVDDVPRQHWDAVEASGTMQLQAWWALNVCYLGINADHDATRELDVRRAIQLAVEREPVVAHYDGTARPTFGLVAQPMAEYDAALRPPGWSDDPAERRRTAAALIEKAGAKGRAVTVYHPQQPRPYLPRPQDIADTVRQQLKAIGLDARIQSEDKSVLFPGVATGRYELVLIGWTTDNGDPDNFYGPLADGAEGRPGESNTSRVVNADVHAKLLAARQYDEPAQRVAAYREIERILQTDVAGYVPLVNTQQAVAYSKSIHGIEVDATGHYRFDRATLE